MNTLLTLPSWPLLWNIPLCPPLALSCTLPVCQLSACNHCCLLSWTHSKTTPAARNFFQQNVLSVILQTATTVHTSFFFLASLPLARLLLFPNSSRPILQSWLALMTTMVLLLAPIRPKRSSRTTAPQQQSFLHSPQIRSLRISSMLIRVSWGRGYRHPLFLLVISPILVRMVKLEVPSRLARKIPSSPSQPWAHILKALVMGLSYRPMLPRSLLQAWSRVSLAMVPLAPVRSSILSPLRFAVLVFKVWVSFHLCPPQTTSDTVRLERRMSCLAQVTPPLRPRACQQSLLSAVWSPT